jgi:hypothetical protein
MNVRLGAAGGQVHQTTSSPLAAPATPSGNQPIASEEEMAAALNAALALLGTTAQTASTRAVQSIHSGSGSGSSSGVQEPAAPVDQAHPRNAESAASADQADSEDSINISIKEVRTNRSMIT